MKEGKLQDIGFRFAIYQSNGREQRLFEYMRFPSQKEADAHCESRTWAGVTYWAIQRN